MIKQTLLVITLLFAQGCATHGVDAPSDGADAGRGRLPQADRFPLLGEDANYRLFTGEGIGDWIRSGGQVGGQDQHAYLMVRVPKAVVDMAYGRPNRVVSLSMEDAATDADVTIHRLAHNPTPDRPMETEVHTAGERDIFGFIQIAINDDGEPAGLIDLTVVRRSEGGVGVDYYTTGTIPSADMPELSNENPQHRPPVAR